MQLTGTDSVPQTATVPLAIHTEVVIDGQPIEQVQVAGGDFVLTDVGRSRILFLAAEGERYLVDERSRRLVRVDRPVDGRRRVWGAAETPDVELGAELQVVNGYDCRRLRLRARLEHVVVEGEAFFTAIPGVEATALHAERVLNALPGVPAHLLDPAEVAVTSTTTFHIGPTLQRQTTRLVSVRPAPLVTSRLAELLSYPRAG